METPLKKEENTVNDFPKIIKQKTLLIFQNEKENIKNDKDMSNQLVNLADSLICENYDLGEEIHIKNQLIEELKNMVLSFQLEMDYMYSLNSNLNTYVNYYLNENNQLRNMFNTFVHNNHPDNIYEEKIEQENVKIKEESITIKSIQSNLINFDKNIVLSYDKLSEIDLNKSEIFIDEDKTNYVGNVNTLLQNVFDDSLEKVLSICKNILNVEYSKRLFIRQINILTIVLSNGESIVISASAVSRSFMYIHFKHMIKICEKCSRSWLLTDGKYEYLYSNRQEPIEYDENHTNETCSGWKQPVKQVDN